MVRRTRRVLSCVIVVLSSLVRAGATAADCNQNGADDIDDIALGTSRDCNSNAVPDECDAQAASLAYATERQYRAGRATSDRVVADMDRDGDLDLVTTNHVAGIAAIFSNDGDGGFAEPRTYPVGEPAARLVVTDLDGDGDDDAVVASSEPEDARPDTVAVMLQDAAGDLGSPVHFTVGLRPYTLRVADLDRDGTRDIVALAYEGGTVHVLLGRGGGAFDPPVAYAVGQWSYDLVVSDLDGDGDADIVIPDAGPWEAPGNTLSLFANDGTGRFPSRDAIAVGENPWSLEAGDVDGDQAPDLVVLSAKSEDVRVLKNHGGLAFTLASTLPVAIGASDMLLLDLDGDLDLDVATTGANIVPGQFDTRSEVMVQWNQGGGTFSDPVVQEVPRHPYSFGGADLDVDGDIDLMIANQFSDDVDIVPILDGGRLGPPVSIDAGRRNSSGPIGVDAADLDGSGKPDIYTKNANGRSVTVLLSVRPEGIPTGCADFVRGDVNQDGFVSLSDSIMLQRHLFGESLDVGCLDALDATDDESPDICDLFGIMRGVLDNENWVTLLPAPFPAPGHDPTPLPLDRAGSACSSGTIDAVRSGFGCERYTVKPASASGDLIRLGTVAGGPGQIVKVPILLTSSVPVDAVQLVVQYDPLLVEIDSGPDSLSFEGSFYESFFGRVFTITYNEGHSTSTFNYGNRPWISTLTVHPAHGVFTVGIGGHLIHSGFEVPPGEDVLLGWIKVRVADTVEDGAEVALVPVNGPDGQGIGPYKLRNELSYKGEARYVSTLPQLGRALIGIVGDQSFFRGDANGDDAVDISDALRTVNYLFLGTERLDCADAADINDDGKLEVTDAIYTLEYLFRGGRVIPAPFAERGKDPTPDALNCYRHRP